MTDEFACGFTPGRKIKAAMWMSVWISLSGGVLSYIGTPTEIVQYVLGITGIGWIFAIGGQALVDAVSQGMWNTKPKAATVVNTNVNLPNNP